MPNTENSKRAASYGYKWQKLWKENNKEAYLKQQKEYREGPCVKTKDKIRLAVYRSKPENKAKRAEYEARRNFLKKKSSSLLTEEHIEEMRDFYLRAIELSCETGVPHEVDHIVPLKGKTVTGLHVPWNLQIIQKSDNCSKGNKFDDWGG